MNIVFGLLIGLAAGALGGMVGIGGGILMVPAMVYFLHFSQKMSQGTSLAVLCMPVGILGAINYYKVGNVDIKVALTLAVGFVGGSLLGSKLAIGLPEASMRKGFAIFLVLVAVQMWFKQVPPELVPSGSSARASEMNPAAESSK